MQPPVANPSSNEPPIAAEPIEIRVDFGKSIVRPNLREWLAAAVILAICFLAIPPAWSRWEREETPLDDRMPYELSEDYWTYRQRMEETVSADRIPIVGDSVVWGEYVLQQESLAADLNSELGERRFDNAGLNGAHPLALRGLLDNYAGALTGSRVMLHCNLLWMGSPERDLQTGDDVPINHPRLLPQFARQLPAYKAPFARRLGILIDRSVSFFDLVAHVRTRYYDGQDLASWTISHPYACPISPLERSLPRDSGELRHDPVPWSKQGIAQQDLPWVDLGTSLQWRAWRQTVLRLRAKGNNVLVIVGPFNEHLLTEASRQRYRSVRQEVETWLADEGIPYIAPDALPSDEYGDASHPLSVGYSRLAKTIVTDDVFREWLAD